jgi:hypoxia up-regulated 1
VILVGAGTRVPKVQERLSERVAMELGKSINTDEAAAMGAVYKAADLSNGFKVKKFLTKDAVLFPIQVSCIFSVSPRKCYVRGSSSK